MKKIAQALALENDYCSVAFYNKWNGCEVYIAEYSASEILYIGYPTFIIIEGCNARFASEFETCEIMGITDCIDAPGTHYLSKSEKRVIVENIRLQLSKERFEAILNEVVRKNYEFGLLDNEGVFSEEEIISMRKAASKMLKIGSYAYVDYYLKPLKTIPYHHIKSKTIFDVCSDEKVLSQITSKKKTAYLSTIKKDLNQNHLDLLKLAEITNDVNLEFIVTMAYSNDV